MHPPDRHGKTGYCRSGEDKPAAAHPEEIPGGSSVSRKLSMAQSWNNLSPADSTDSRHRDCHSTTESPDILSQNRLPHHRSEYTDPD